MYRAKVHSCLLTAVKAEGDYVHKALSSVSCSIKKWQLFQFIHYLYVWYKLFLNEWLFLERMIVEFLTCKTQEQILVCVDFTQKILPRKALSGQPESQSQSTALLNDVIHIDKTVPVLESLESGDQVRCSGEFQQVRSRISRLAEPGRKSRVRQATGRELFEFR